MKKLIIAALVILESSTAFAAEGWTNAGYIRRINPTLGVIDIFIEAAPNGKCTAINLAPEQIPKYHGGGMSKGSLSPTASNLQQIMNTITTAFIYKKKITIYCYADGSIYGVDMEN